MSVPIPFYVEPDSYQVPMLWKESVDLWNPWSIFFNK